MYISPSRDPKYYLYCNMGLQQQGKLLPLEGGVTRDKSQREIPTGKKERLVMTSVGIRELLDSGTLVGCVS